MIVHAAATLGEGPNRLAGQAGLRSGPHRRMTARPALTRRVSEVSQLVVLAYASGWYGPVRNPG